MTFTSADVERFNKKWVPEPNSGCWLWLGAIKPQGYGNFWTQVAKWYSAHVFSYRLHRKEIPSGLVLDHLCRVRSCVNPRHLEPVTSAENSHRGAMTKLTAAQVRAIFLDPRPYSVIAAEYRIPANKPGVIKRRIKWVSVTKDLVPHINPRGRYPRRASA